MLEVVLSGAIAIAMLFAPPALVFGLAIREQHKVGRGAPAQH